MAKKIAVIYHGECWDGFGGAYAAWKKFGSKAEYIGPRRGEEVKAENIKGRDAVYIIDYDLRNKEKMLRLVKANKKVVALDHHISGEKMAEMATEHVYQLNHSGCTIAWKYFFPNKPIPWLFKRIEDFDIWKWKVPYTKEMVAYMDMIPHKFKLWDKIIRALENPKTRRPIIEKGRLLNAYEERTIEKIAERPTVVKFEGYKALAVNSPILRDQIGSVLYKKMPPISIVWREREGVAAVSLRSNGEVDVAKIAEKYGGGGHREAAGFAFNPNKKFPWKRLKK